MKKPIALTAAFAASVCLTLGGTTAALADDSTVTADNAVTTPLTEEPEAVSQGVSATEVRAAIKGTALEGKFEEILAKLPANWRERQNRKIESADLEHSDWTEAILGAINPDDYECDASAFNEWIDAEIGKFDFGTILILAFFGVLDYPTYDALLYQDDSTEQYFGQAGQYTKSLTKGMERLQSFWDIKSFDIQLLAMHGNMLQDRDRVARMVTFFLGAEGDEALELADTFIEILAADPAAQAGEHPLFTLNAFAFTAEGDPDPTVAGLPDKIVMGDGIMEAMEQIGLDDTTGRQILGHEFGHHIQYEENLFESDLTGPEATRRTELMADAFGVYFLVHKKGLAANHKGYLTAQRLSFEIGDCSFDSNGHHGTPNQRLRAVKWGYNQYQDQANPARIVLPVPFAAKFDKALPKLVRPDA